MEWKRESLYKAETDFVFASIRLKGKKRWVPTTCSSGTSSRAPAGRHCGEGDRLAQLPSFAGDEPAGDGRGREGGAGIIASCERPNDARYLHQSGLAAEAGRECEGGRDDVAGCTEKASAPFSTLDAVGGGRVVLVNSWY